METLLQNDHVGPRERRHTSKTVLYCPRPLTGGESFFELLRFCGQRQSRKKLHPHTTSPDLAEEHRYSFYAQLEKIIHQTRERTSMMQNRRTLIPRSSRLTPNGGRAHSQIYSYVNAEIHQEENLQENTDECIPESYSITIHVHFQDRN